MDKEYDDMIVEGRPNDEYKVVDKYLGINLIFDVCTKDKHRGTVVKLSQVLDGRAIGHSRTNYFFETRQYEIYFKDGTRDEYTVNIIVENMYAQLDYQGHQSQLLAEIKDHQKDGKAISKEEGKISYANVTDRYNITTRGWQLMVMWKDGSTYWIQLKDIKDSNPVKVAQYAVANFIQDDPKFSWWYSKLLRRQNIIISKEKSKYCRITQKQGI